MRFWRRRRRAIRIGCAVFAALVVLWPLLRAALAPGPPPPDEASRQQAQRVRILRDRWGVPHVFGQSDADAAFGLAWAHAEDDWPLIQLSLAAARGRLGLVSPGRQALLNDFYAAFVDVEGEVARHWQQADPRFREVLEAYARGLNFYAWHHPGEVEARLLPFTGADIARGFAHKLPYMLGVPATLAALTKSPVRLPADTHRSGSNAQAVAASRSTDGVTRLNVNSHQPWTGPVSWYEVQIHSEEGWNMSGGLFPGAPMVLHGHNEHLGWALTVNQPDLVDVYELVVDEQHPGQYRFGGQWRDIESARAWLPLETPWLTLWIPKTIQRSVHGPVLETERGPMAIRYSSAEGAVAAGEQWFRMNKATTYEQWRAAMQRLAIPMFNVVYADREHVFYAYNARIPVRDERFDYTQILSGDEPAALWSEFLAFDALPQVLDPASGFVQGCNSTPYSATAGAGNPEPAQFPRTAGIETYLTNRSTRTLSLLGGAQPISRADFLAMKWDRRFDSKSTIWQRMIEPLRKYRPASAQEQRALELLLQWDGDTPEVSMDAAVAVLTWRSMHGRNARDEMRDDPVAAFRSAVQFLEEGFGRVDVPLGELQRLRRGPVDLPLGGGPDTLNCIMGELREGRLVADQGDSLVVIAEFAATGTWSESIHQFGASNRPASPHFADQAPLFAARELKPVHRAEEDVRAFLEAEYHPGDPVGAPVPADAFTRLKQAREISEARRSRRTAAAAP